MLDLAHLVKTTKQQLNTARIQRRRQALGEARDLLKSKMGALTEQDLRHLLQLFNADLVQGRETFNRFATGLVGRNANLLVGKLDGVNAAIRELWQADDTWLVANLGRLRHGGSLTGGGWLFLSMVLHAREPARFFPMSTTMRKGLSAIDGGPRPQTRDGAVYLDYCRRVHVLLEARTIAEVGADLLLWNAASMAGEADEVDAEEQVAAEPATVASSPPADAPPSQSRVDASASVTVNSQNYTPASNTGSVGWLHLTDLHQGMDGASWLWPNVLAQLFDDLAKLHDLCGPWDLVLFTGDLTQKGKPDEFARLDATLERLWKRLDQLGSRPKLVCVPGNHDLQRPHALDPVVLALSHWHSNVQLRDYVFASEDNPYRVKLREAFAAYTEWTARAPWHARAGLTRGTMPGDVSLSLSLNGLDVGIVGLNSAFLQLTGADFSERLAVDPRQLHRVCEDYAPEWMHRHHITLLMTHHPPEWLAPQARQEFRHEIDVAGRFAAHFFGHMHEGAATSTSHGGGHARHAIQGASLFGLEEFTGHEGRHVQRIHGYSAGRFELLPAVDGAGKVRVRIFPRRMFASPSGRRIAPDVQMYDLDDRGSFFYDVSSAKRR